MRRLVLMRHAKSSWGDPGLDDHDRPLNKRGKRSAEALGDWLRAQTIVVDEALVSSSARTVTGVPWESEPETIRTRLPRMRW